MANNALATQVAFGRIQSIGLEAEGWSESESSVGLPTDADGHWDDDAGLNQCEAITRPQPTVDQAIAVLEEMFAGKNVRLQPFRPDDLQHNAGCWQSALKYRAKRDALASEAPNYRDWLEYKMPNYASLQVNVSGDFDPFGDAGAFLADMINCVGPKHAAEIHRDLGYGFGHLGLWQFFGYAERFPQPDRWFGSGAAMVRYFESIPRLMRLTATGFVTNPAGERQSVHDQGDLGNVWWYGKPKRSELGPYLEVRHLPSMPLALAKPYVQQVVDMVELLLWWFVEENGSQPVSTCIAAQSAFTLLHQQFGRYLPEKPLDRTTWRCLVREG